MTVRGVRLIKGKEPLLRQVIFELRYQQGFVYLDRCGKILNRIVGEYPEWIIGNELNPQAAPLYSMRNRCRFTFSSAKLDLSLDNTHSEQEISEEELIQFLKYVGPLSQIVIDELGGKTFPRIGFRVIYYFPCENMEDAERWLASLGVVTVAPKLMKAFEATLDACGSAMVLLGPDCRYRIAFNGVEQSAQLDMGPEMLQVKASALDKDKKQYLKEQLKIRRLRQVNSATAVVIDVDAYHEHPLSPDPGDFSTRHSKNLPEMVRKAVAD